MWTFGWPFLRVIVLVNAMGVAQNVRLLLLLCSARLPLLAFVRWPVRVQR